MPTPPKAMDLTERLLIERAKTDPQAFGALFDTYYPVILNYILRRTGDVATAQDITAETFMKALKALPKFRWRGVSIEAWLYAIAGNELRGHFRKARRVESLDELYEEVGFELPDEYDLAEELEAAQHKLERHATFVQAQKIIQTLPPKYQEVVVLRFGEQKKISEIAAILGKREGTVKSLLSRGLGQLRKELRAQNTQPHADKRVVASEGRTSLKPQEDHER